MLSKSLPFLQELIANNHKDWFDAHRSEYLAAKEEFELFIEQLIDRIRAFDPTIGHLTVKDCVYRIHRDLRFSPDKTPYKNHFGAYIAQGGRKSELCGYYFHVEPASAGYLNNSLWAGGVYWPAPDVLKAIRTDIYENIDEYKNIILGKSFKNFFKWFNEKPARMAPKGFPKDFADIDLLKPREYSFYRNIDTQLLTSPKLLDESIRVFKAMKPFNDFMNRAILYHREIAE